MFEGSSSLKCGKLHFVAHLDPEIGFRGECGGLKAISIGYERRVLIRRMAAKTNLAPSTIAKGPNAITNVGIGYLKRTPREYIAVEVITTIRSTIAHIAVRNIAATNAQPAMSRRVGLV